MSTIVKFDVDVMTWITSNGDPDDKWSRDSTDGSVSIHGARIVKTDAHDALTIDKELSVGDVVFLVWAQYSSGDSFCQNGGNYELLELLTDSTEAFARKKHYEETKDYSVPWTGYFEHLDFVRIDTFMLGV